MEAHRLCDRLDYAFKVPIRSMSTTTRKPFDDCALAAATKLPAPETSTYYSSCFTVSSDLAALREWRSGGWGHDE